MYTLDKLDSTIDDKINDQEKYFSELNIDNDFSSDKQSIINIPEDNPLDSFSENDANVEECTALVTLQERKLIAAQTMFKKSIKVSIKSFLISLSLSFLNLFI